VATNPGVDARRFRRFLQDRVKIVHGIASFLLAHLEFAGDGLAERAINLARNTLAYYLGNEQQRTQIETVFQTVAERILEGAATEELRTTLRRSPLAPTTVNKLKAWLDANRQALTRSLGDGSLLATMSAVMLEYNRSSIITSLSDQSVMPLVIASWVTGATFSAIFQLLVERNIAPLLSDPMKREILSSEFLLTYLHTLIRVPFELLSDYCEDFDRASPGGSLLKKMKSEPWYGVAYIVRNAVSHNFHIEFGKLREKIPISWRTTSITADMDGRPMTAEIFWHRPGYELFLEMQAFAELLPEP
jgi:hypothetical protein